MKLYLRFFAMHLKCQMQYKVSFFFTAIGQFLVAFTTVLTVHFLFERFGSVGGFSSYEAMLGFAVIVASYSIGAFFGRGFDRFPRMISDGSFDRALVRPRSPIFQVLASEINFARVGATAQSLLVFFYVLPRVGVEWNALRVLVLVLMVACGSILFFSFFILYGAFAFFTIEGLEFLHILTSGAREHGRLPFSAYGEGVLRFLTFVIPLALVQYYPLLFLIGRENSMFYAIMPLFSLLFLLPCYALFRFGLKRYHSTGS